MNIQLTAPARMVIYSDFGEGIKILDKTRLGTDHGNKLARQSRFQDFITARLLTPYPILSADTIVVLSKRVPETQYFVRRRV